MLIRAVSARCAVKTETVVIITSLWLIFHYLRLIQHYCWLYSHTDSIMHIQWSTYRLFKAYHACVHLKRQFSQELKTRYGLLTFVSFQIHTSSRGDVLMNVHAALFHLMKVGDGDLCWKISKNTYHKMTFNYGCKI